jgi:hypothetical protein
VLPSGADGGESGNGRGAAPCNGSPRPCPATQGNNRPDKGVALSRLLTLRLGGWAATLTPRGCRPARCRSEHADAPRSRNASEAIHRREFGPRDPQAPNQLRRCLPRWQAAESGTTRGGGGRIRAERAFPACGAGPGRTGNRAAIQGPAKAEPRFNWSKDLNRPRRSGSSRPRRAPRVGRAARCPPPRLPAREAPACRRGT